jgi:hypothetical protein
VASLGRDVGISQTSTGLSDGKPQNLMKHSLIGMTACSRLDPGGRAVLRGRRSGSPHVLEAVEVERCHFSALSTA